MNDLNAVCIHVFVFEVGRNCGGGIFIFNQLSCRVQVVPVNVLALY
jgi:hypothetical protein